MYIHVHVYVLTPAEKSLSLGTQVPLKPLWDAQQGWKSMG